MLEVNSLCYCGEKHGGNEGIVYINSVNDDDESENDPEKRGLVYDDVQIVPLETNDSCLISVMKEIRIVDSLVFVMDNKELLVFDRNDGRFISKIGKEGSGPEDYISLNSFFIDERSQTVSIIDEMKRAIISYDFNGAFKGKKGIPVDVIKYSSHSYLVDENIVLSNYWMNGEINMGYRLFNTKNSHVLCEKSYSPIKLSNYMCEFSKHPISKTKDGFDFIMPLSDTIFTIRNNKVVPKYVINRKSRMAPIDKFVSTPKNSMFSLYLEYGQKGYFTGFESLYETEDYLLLGYRHRGAALAAFLVNKRNKKGTYFLYSHDSKQIQKMQDIPFFVIMGCDKDYFVSMYQPDVLMGLNVSGKSSSASVKKLKQVVGSLKEDDNPVLIFYKLKKLAK